MACHERAVYQIGQTKTLTTVKMIPETSNSIGFRRPPLETKGMRQDFFCQRCGTVSRNQLAEPPHDCVATSVKFIEQRTAICGHCQHNVDRVCTRYKQIHPERDCLVSVGVRMPFVSCPAGRWRKQSLKCPNCGRHSMLAGREVICRFCKWGETHE